MSRLTILMPVYNAGPYVAESIRSLLEQTFIDFELWIIDDGSTDDTRKQIESFQDARIKKWFYEINRGKSVVVNEIIYHVATEFFTVTDGDDISHAKRLELQIDKLERDEELMMCGTSYTAIDEHGFILRSLELSSDYKEIYSSIVRRSQFLGATVIFRLQVLNHLDEFYREYFKDHLEDCDLDARLVDQFKCVNLVQKLYYYRILKDSLSRLNYTPRKAQQYAAVAFLISERRKFGIDSLKRGVPETLDSLLKQKMMEMVQSPSLFNQQAAFYFMYWKISDAAWHHAVKAMKSDPLNLKNLFLVAYIAVLIAWSTVTPRKYYKEITLER